MRRTIFVLTIAVACACGGGGGGGTGPTMPPQPVTNVAITNGCYSVAYQGQQQSALGCGTVQTLGDPGLDQRFVEEIGIQAQFWQGVPATVFAFDECAGVMNALAIPPPHRLILFGRNLTQNVLKTIGNELPLAGVLAHEFGHQAQFSFGWMSSGQSTARPTELEADAFSGYYMALVKGWAGPQLNSYLQGLASFGDYEFNSPNHHGTPQERAAAGLLGLQTGFTAIAQGTPFSYLQLHEFFSTVIATEFSAVEAQQLLTLSDPAAGAALVPKLDLERVEAVRLGIESLDSVEDPAPGRTPRLDLAPI